jgi:hypothetical protein
VEREKAESQAKLSALAAENERVVAKMQARFTEEKVWG